jgi:segregation and condensation protein B
VTLRAKVEAVLFMTDKPIKAAAIARIVNGDVQMVRQALLELIREYEERPGGLQITDEEGYAFQVKDEYSSLMNEFAPVEMSAALLRTLSAICIKQPVMQSEIIRVRGAGAYEHIKELVVRELVAKKDDGRSPMLTTTKKFQDYFRLTKDGNNLRTYLKKQVKAAQAAEAAATAEAETLASDKQLELPVVAGDSGADQKLNERMYLELSDGDDDTAVDGSAPVAEAAGSDAEEPAPEEENSSFVPPVSEVFDATPPPPPPVATDLG